MSGLGGGATPARAAASDGRTVGAPAVGVLRTGVWVLGFMGQRTLRSPPLMDLRRKVQRTLEGACSAGRCRWVCAQLGYARAGARRCRGAPEGDPERRAPRTHRASI